jgi:hypothetical protein
MADLKRKEEKKAEGEPEPKRQKRVILEFYSRSKDRDARYLSNFQRLDTPLKNGIDCRGDNNYGILEFPSVEACYGAKKWAGVVPFDRVCNFEINERHIKKFTVGGEYTALAGPQLKAKHGRKAMTEAGVFLTHAWNESVMLMHMRHALESRAAVDARFKNALIDYANRGVYLLHYNFRAKNPYKTKKGEYRDGSFWDAKMKDGVMIGRNELGKLMMELGAEWVKQQK